MLERYLVNVSDRRVPLTAGRYIVTPDFEVFDNINCSEVVSFTDINSEIWVKIDFGYGEVQIPKGVAICLVMKPVKVPWVMWKDLRVLYINGNSKDLHPGNLVWKFPDRPLLKSAVSGFKYIPGYSSYLINKEGLVFSIHSDRVLSSYRDKLGYSMQGLNPDIGNRTIVGTHRLLALAFLDYPSNVGDLDVNHIDGNKENNELSNLEWVSRKENCDHAYRTGLRKENIHVSVKSAFSGEEFLFYSIEHCAKAMNVSGGSIFLRLKTDGQKLCPPGFLVKKKDSTTPWASIADPEKVLLSMNVPRKVEVTDCNGLVSNHLSISDFLRSIGLSSSAAYHHSKSSRLVFKIKGHTVRLLTYKQTHESAIVEMRIASLL